MGVYEDCLVYLGGFGRYQRWICLALSLVALFHAWQVLGIVFLAGSPDHWCYNPDLDRFNISEESRKILSVPLELKDGVVRFSMCKMYDINFTTYTEGDIEDMLQRPGEYNLTTPVKTKSCNRWKYDPASRFQRTIVTQWNLVCDRRWLVPTAASVFMAGMMIGVYVFGEIADRFGRRPSLLSAIVIFNVSSVLVAFSPNYTAFVIIRFIVGFSTMAINTTGFILRVELVSTKWRVLNGTATGFCWSIGFMLLAAIAYGVPNWVQLQLTLSIPALFYLTFFLFFIPESPRWLFAKHRDEEACVIIEKMAEVNGVEVPKCVLGYQEKDEGEELNVKNGTLIDLFRTPNMRRKTLALCFNWFVVSFVYYGLSLNTANLGGNKYLTFLYFGAVEIPALLCGFLAVTYVGRRWVLAGFMVMAGVPLLLTMAVPKGLHWLVVALSLSGKFCITAAFDIIYIYSAELFPTEVRNIGVGFGSLNARLAAIIAPFIAFASTINTNIPSATFGVLAILAGLVALLLPETLGQILPDTLEEGELFGKYKKTNDTSRNSEDRILLQ